MMAEEKALIRSLEGKALWLTINRPKAFNALNSEVFQGIREGLAEAEANPNIAVVVITGAGEKAFSAGADVEKFKSPNVEEVREFIKLGQETILKVLRFPKPTIAAVNGVALGGGCELAMACDIRIASENARFGQPEPRLGIIPGWGGTQLMPRLLGLAKAKELLLTGRVISAQEAERLGLVSRVVAQGELKKAVEELVETIGGLAPLAIQAVKRILTAQAERMLEEGLREELESFMKCYETEDRVEGVSAFFEKRKPAFKGR